jgi:dethiobiotin synthetase
MARGVFITGTDTEAGKTYVTAALAAAFAASGMRVAAVKPVATGARWRDGRLESDDAIRLAAAANVPELRHCRYAFAEPIAPHIAAARAGTTIELEALAAWHRELEREADWILVEGIGGWRVPLSERAELADVARMFGYPVLLVVGLRLGCINHAILTAQAIAADGLRLAGWIANRIDPTYTTAAETIEILQGRIGTPPLACLRHVPATDAGGVVAALTPVRDCLMN